MFRCQYACARCQHWWCESWDQIDSDVCDRCKTRSKPIHTHYQRCPPLLENFLADRRHQFRLFGDDNA